MDIRDLQPREIQNRGGNFFMSCQDHSVIIWSATAGLFSNRFYLIYICYYCASWVLYGVDQHNYFNAVISHKIMLTIGNDIIIMGYTALTVVFTTSSPTAVISEFPVLINNV